ncbi:tRNA-uridine aminocarboxypropyltransferase [Neptuniibacter sp. SY11_33]|uniref:tRNA-uridine aminocarboxypropyltransferase n=1 Tax=Neptuniibacter sp. SY11_33 TaxID=3398215 RepID=UPI0039F52571
MNKPKPFVARGSKTQRCQSCLLSVRACICDYKIQYDALASFYLLMHHDETFKPTNTGRLIEDCIAGTQRFKWSRTEPGKDLLKAINHDAIDPYIVFPEGDDYQARMVDFELKPGKKPVFIILDGTWRQARRMFRHSRYLDHLPVIQPQITSTSQYKLRKAAVAGQLCTAEVAAEMLKLAGDQKGAEIMSDYFAIFNSHYRAARLNRPLDDEAEEKRRLKACQLALQV